jgi:DNA-directed RNA polymerase subunit M/transcription elongation factor TFIIS
MNFPPVIKGVRPPSKGEHDFFKCKDCGHRFGAVIRILSFLQKCPKCGGRNVIHDSIISY